MDEASSAVHLIKGKFKEFGENTADVPGTVSSVLNFRKIKEL